MLLFKVSKVKPAPLPQPHTHYFHTISSSHEGHTHFIQAFTFPVNGTSTDDHFHTFKGVTPNEHGHQLFFTGITGPAIPLPDGSHIHEVVGSVSRDVQGRPTHTHEFKALTGRPLGQEPPGW
ncbi:YmaF family protein [Ammoniphilus sp. CFH 90114]|uniref:YmaF family protein n=1 Tax=Ammoniphilus sp. CFH 90114 TaxID=2493665 RepID=UPI00100E6B55|nr:YmaF family protein [Ammoniphilus sp. CFH 90114]RXT04318.1 hypothetical protein EIZ39_20785 [Ammoniphilus sp. CFH 90114]